MTSASLAPSETLAIPTIPLKAVVPWLLFAAAMVGVLYFLILDQGAMSIVPGNFLHEFAHDGRHLFGFPLPLSGDGDMTTSVRPLLVRGMLAGLAGGALAFVISYVLGEGPLSAGIAFEERTAAAETMPGMAMGDEEIVSRAVQSTLGLGVVAVLYGVAIGGLFGLAYAVAQGRLGTSSVRATALIVAVAGFVGAYVIPQLKYPANPPGINSGDTTVPRVESYLAILFIGILVAAGVLWLAGRLRERFDGWNATLLALLAGVVVVGVAYAALPRIDETPPDFPATVLWQFRISSLAAQAALWATLGLVFGALTERARRPRVRPAETVGSLTG